MIAGACDFSNKQLCRGWNTDKDVDNLIKVPTKTRNLSHVSCETFFESPETHRAFSFPTNF